MKKCKFCAEEIQDEAIICRFCNKEQNAAPQPAGRAPAASPDDEKKIIYEGSPSWRAFVTQYAMIVVLAPVVSCVAYWIVNKESGMTRALSILVPLAVGGIAFFVTTLVRRSTRVRMTNRSVENESGVFSKKIDVLELWRIRDVRYKQSLLDRILGIAHIEVFTKDVTSPHFEVVGLPASRQLFEKLRDSIEIQRQSKRVMGLME